MKKYIGFISTILLLFGTIIVYRWLSTDTSWKPLFGKFPITAAVHKQLFYIKGENVKNKDGTSVLGHEELWSVSTDGRGKRQITHSKNQAQRVRLYSAAPSFQAVAYETYTGSQTNHTTELWYYHTSMKNPTKIFILLPGYDGPADYCPRERCYTITGQYMQWSPDSRYLVFLAAPDARHVDIYVADLSTASIRRLTYTGTQKKDLSLLSNGTTLGFCEYAEPMKDGPCFRIDSIVSPVIKITRNDAHIPAKAPNWTAVIDDDTYQRNIIDQASSGTSATWQLIKKDGKTARTTILDEGQFIAFEY